MFLSDFRGTQRRFPPKYIENTFLAIQSRCGSLEMHSKRRYKICICLVILEELESSKLQGRQYYFPENFTYNSAYYESDNFFRIRIF